MTFSYNKRRKKIASSAPSFDRKLDEAVFREIKSLPELLGMSEEDFKRFVKNAIAWKY